MQVHLLHSFSCTYHIATLELSEVFVLSVCFFYFQAEWGPLGNLYNSIAWYPWFLRYYRRKLKGSWEKMAKIVGLSYTLNLKNGFLIFFLNSKAGTICSRKIVFPLSKNPESVSISHVKIIMHLLIINISGPPECLPYPKNEDLFTMCHFIKITTVPFFLLANPTLSFNLAEWAVLL